MLAPSLPQPKSDISDFGRLRCRTRVNPSSDGRVAERSEAGWGSPQRVIDERQHALQIARHSKLGPPPGLPRLKAGVGHPPRYAGRDWSLWPQASSISAE